MEQELIQLMDWLLEKYGSDGDLGIRNEARLRRFAFDTDWAWFLLDTNSPLGIKATPAIYAKCGEVWHAYSEYHRAIYTMSPTDYSLAWGPKMGE